MMIMDGINIYPAEIEDVITRHTAVEDAAVMPMRHAIHQDIPTCAVVLSKDAKVSNKELIDFMYKRLGSRSPREIFILDYIPRNEQGKVIRPELSKILSIKLDIKREQVKNDFAYV